MSPSFSKVPAYLLFISFLLFCLSCISSDVYDFQFATYKQRSSFFGFVSATHSVLKLSEATLELAGAKAASCGRLAILSSLSEKGTYSYLEIYTQPCHM